MKLSRVRFVTAQLGRKPGKQQVMARLLSGRDLPGGHWRVVDQRTWRTGRTGPPTSWGQRAGDAGSITGWRSFRDPEGARWAWIQAAPMASPADAASALDGVAERGIANLRARVRLVSQTAVTLEPFTGASAVQAYEQHTDGLDGPGLVLMLAVAAGHWIMVICLSGSPAWDWPSASQLAAQQAQRLTA